MSGGNVRCPSCSRVLRPPDGYDRFRCPCGQVLQRPAALRQPAASNRRSVNRRNSANRPTPARAAATQNQSRVRCPSCSTVLLTPPGASTFRCTCGVVLRAPSNPTTVARPRPQSRNSNAFMAQSTMSRPTELAAPSDSNSASVTSRMASMFRGLGALRSEATSKRNVREPIEDKIMPDEAIAQATNKAGEFWLRNLGEGQKLFWVRLMSEEQELKIAKLLTTWEADMAEKLEDLEAYDLSVRLEQLGMNKMVKDPEDEDEMRELLKGSKAHCAQNYSEEDLVAKLNNLNVDHTSCVGKGELVERLMAAVWYGPTRLCDGFVREFRDDDLIMVPAQQFGLPLEYKKHKIRNETLERMSQASFKAKAEWFKELCDNARIPWEEGKVELTINRSDLLRDSFYKIHQLKPIDFRKQFKFKFAGEEGIDAGGLGREWFHQITQACFNVDFGLFEYSAVNNSTYQFNPASKIANELDDEYFQFIGRIVGKALFDQKYIEAHLTQPIFKHILGYPITVDDIQFCNQEVYKNLKEIEEMEENVADLFLSFSCTKEVFGEIQEVELKEGGLDIEVTNANVQEYIMLMTKHYMFERTKAQLTQFLKGIYEVIPEIWLSVFDYKELELLLCGLPKINVEDWKANTKYRGNYAKKGHNHRVVKWFWEYVKACNQEQRARLLQYCTGTSRVPVTGFKALQGRNGVITPFTIEAVSTTKLIYPKAHTCFNRIDLPEYKTKSELVKRVEEACSMSMVGFNDE